MFFIPKTRLSTYKRVIALKCDIEHFENVCLLSGHDFNEIFGWYLA